EMPPVIPHAVWQAKPPLGYVADATRRNKPAGDSLAFHDITVTVLSTSVDSSTVKPAHVAHLRLARGAEREDRLVRDGSAFNWQGYHVAVVGIYGPGGLGAGLGAPEVVTI